jgi:hypothetical protein
MLTKPLELIVATLVSEEVKVNALVDAPWFTLRV